MSWRAESTDELPRRRRSNRMRPLQAPEPHPALQDLDFLVGEWEREGREDGSSGIDYAGRRVRGVEYIGKQGSSGMLRSYFFSNEGPGPFGDVAGYQATMSRIGSRA
jgi:hypothetical protein